MKKNRLLLIALLLVWLAPSFAARVDTLLVKSPSMNKEIKVVVVTDQCKNLRDFHFMHIT